MPRATRPLVFRYGSVLLTVAVALLLRFTVWPLLGPDLPFLFLWPAVIYCAWYGGLGPGLLATFVSALAGRYFLLQPLHSFALARPADGIGILLYLALGCFLSLLIEGFHRAKRQVEEHALDLYNQREWFRVTLASIGDAVIATDAEARVAFLNQTAQRLTGWSEEQAIGLPLDKVFRIVNEETRLPVENPVYKALEVGDIVGLANHTLLLRLDGAELPIDDSAAPIRSETGSILGVVLVFRDITERRRLESELERRADELVQADQRKNEFLAMLAHELRNPLGPIQNAVHILKHFGSADSPVLKAASVIERQAMHVRRLVEDMMDISRISRGKLSLQRQPLDLVEVIRQACEMCRPAIDARKHALSVKLPEEPIQLEADPARLTQVVVNLLTNAVKYTPEGGLISLSVEQEGGQVAVRVSDNGMGIAPEMLPHIFDLFAQAPRTLASSQGGLGIGLSLVRRLVEMHGGTIQASSDGPGQGSQFVARLPVIDRAQEWKTAPPHEETGGGAHIQDHVRAQRSTDQAR
jgi:PAS domain S-box-containing protein